MITAHKKETRQKMTKLKGLGRGLDALLDGNDKSKNAAREVLQNLKNIFFTTWKVPAAYQYG